MNLALFILRLVLGIVFLYHGSSKMRHSKMMAQSMGMPSAMPLMLGTLEFLAAIGLILGVFVQASAVVVGVVMLGALFMKIFKWKMPFSVSEKPGWALDLVILAVAIAVYLMGAGSIII